MCGVDGCRYVIDGGLRHVEPYDYVHAVHAKKRWYGRSLLSVFSAEFSSGGAESYERAIRLGLLTVNGRPTSPTAVVRASDIVRHRLHRHEPPVRAEPISVLHSDDRLLVVNKPSSIPIHPCQSDTLLPAHC